MKYRLKCAGKYYEYIVTNETTSLKPVIFYGKLPIHNVNKLERNKQDTILTEKEIQTCYITDRVYPLDTTIETKGIEYEILMNGKVR